MEPAGGGVAPFASVEDLSDEQEQESPGPARLTLPGADGAAGPKSPKMGVPTPRIDISRASSSSHQDDSSPERDLFTGGEGAPVAKLGLGFTEEMAAELRNSTEELDFQDPTELETKQRRRKLHQQQAVNKYELEMQGEKDKERKDSACSDTGLLYISGRTSRLSSIGSAASGGSAASHASGASGVSGISAASHLSATSQLSRASRCSSPHKMLLETSFCGPKPIPTVSLDAEYPPKESVEATLLARATDPTGAVLPVQEQNMVNGKTSRREKSKSTKSSSSTLSVTREPSVKSKSSDRSKPQSGKESRSSSFHSRTSRTPEPTKDVEVVAPSKTEEEKSTPIHRKEPPRLPPGSDAKFISLHGNEEQPVVSVSRSKSKTLPLEPDQRIISLHGDDEPPVQSEPKRTLPLDNDSKFISLHSDPPPQPPKTLVVSTSKRKTPSKESSKTLSTHKPEPKSLSLNTSKRKEPIKYEGDQIFIPLTGDETPIVLSGGKKPPSSTIVLEGDSRIIPLHGSPEEEIEKPSQKANSTILDKDSRIIPLKGDEIEIHTTTRKIKDSDQPQPKALPPRKKPTIPPDASAVIIPLHGDEEIVALEIETDRPSSPEYGIYIPLKGPLPESADFTKKSPMEPKPRQKQEIVSKTKKLDVKPKGKTPKTSPTTVESKPIKKKADEELVKFISLHADESERQPIKVEIQEELLDDEKYNLKPEDLRPKSVSPIPGYHSDIQSIQHAYFKPDDSAAYARKHSTSSCRSPEFEGIKQKPATLDLTSIIRPSRPVQSLTQLTRDESRTPSPATSMSRGSLFRRSSESSSSTKSRASGKKKKEKYNTIAGNRSQNISSEFRTRKDSKNKSVFSSLFKKGSRDSVRRKSESSEKTTPMDPRLAKVEFTFNQQDRRGEPDTIIIPLHSPDSAPAPLTTEDVPPPEVTAQSISEVVAAIEELKSQPLVLPVPTPTISSVRKKREEASATEKTEPKVETVKQIDQDLKLKTVIQTEENLLESKRKTEEKLDLKIKQEIEKLQDTKLEKEKSPSIESKKDQDAKTKLEKDKSASIELKKDDAKTKQELEVTLRTSLEADISPRSETSGGSSKTQLEAPLDKQDSDRKSDTETIKTGSEERRSSESEPDSDAVPIPPVAEDEHERKGLFLQQESVEDELPYVPTTLPQERPVAHPIIPVKQRGPEAVKTCPIDRPRSTTPIDPSKLDEYVSSPHDDPSTSAREKMQIVLPRKESLRERSKSPHKAGAKPWTHFAEQGLQSPRELRRVSSPSPPPLPPRAWVCFDELPERRRTPKRITTLPPTQPHATGVVYSYVNPEECSCECHETQGRVNGAQCSDAGAHCSYKDPYRT